MPTPDPPDLGLLLRKKVLSDPEVKDLYDRFRPPCERFLWSRFSSSIQSGTIDVMGVFHDAFVKFLMVGRHRINDPEAALSYLFTSCRRLALSILRKKSLPTATEEEGEAHPALGNPGTFPVESEFARELSNREFVAEGLRLLKEESERYHDVLVMTYFEGMTTENICERLRITQNNYYVIVMRAKQKLKTILDLLQTRRV